MCWARRPTLAFRSVVAPTGKAGLSHRRGSIWRPAKVAPRCVTLSGDQQYSQKGPVRLLTAPFVCIADALLATD